MHGKTGSKIWTMNCGLPACRRLLFALLHAEKGPPRATKEIGDVCTQAKLRATDFFSGLVTLSLFPYVCQKGTRYEAVGESTWEA